MNVGQLPARQVKSAVAITLPPLPRRSRHAVKRFVSLRYRFRHHISQRNRLGCRDRASIAGPHRLLRRGLCTAERSPGSPPARHHGRCLNSPAQTAGAIRARAERTLTEEFGPYAVTEGMPPCAAPIRLVEECDGCCGSCAWLWLDPQPVSEEPAAGVPSFAGALPGFM